MSDISRYTGAIPPLSTIKDADTRRVLEAIVNGWRTRNGELKPDSDERFITKGELRKLVSDVNRGYFAEGGDGYDLVNSQNVPTSVQKYVQQFLQATTDDILNNKLWVKLGERIPLLDIPGIFTKVDQTEIVVQKEINQRISADEAIVESVTALGARVGVNEAGLLSETSIRVNSDNALVDAVNTIWAAVGNNAGIVQGGSQVTANTAGAIATNWNQVQAQVKDPYTGAYLSTATVRDQAFAEVDRVKGRLTAERTIKVDVNGYVAGIGVIATSDMNTGATSSAVIVRADKFAVGSASTGDKVPFKVYTTNTVAPDGVTVITPGVYIDTAVIGDGTIGRAKIGVAEIDTLRIAGEAVFVTRYGEQIVAGVDLSGAYTGDICSVSFTITGLPTGNTAKVGVVAVIQAYPSNSTVTNLQTAIFANGSILTAIGNTYDSSGISIANAGYFEVGNGTHTASVRVRCDANPGGSPAKANNSFFTKILVLPAKR